jgi:2-polyprenyl-3-methyl-5-hydroxy-6-metoxy-1,4-benzoquinol methylase
MLLPFRAGSRVCEPEIMDQPGLDIDRHRHALRGLERINAWSGSVRWFWPALRALAHRQAPRPVRVLDVGSGGGDVLRAIRRRAARAGLAMVLEGCDRSAAAVAFAQERAAAAGADVRFFVADLLQQDLPGDYDAVVCSLFLHHFSEEQAVSVLRRMAAASRGLVLINDLRRCFAGWLLAHTAGRLLTTSPVVHVDGPRSVAAAWTRAEILTLARRAGLAGATYRAYWPCRFLLSWTRT